MKKIKSILATLVALLLINAITLAQIANNSDKIPCMPCEELMNLDLPDVQISEALMIDKQSKFCRVSGIIGTEIKFILLLPGSWNERFVMGGGGGFVGSVHNQQGKRVHDGYATAGTDTGHEGLYLEGGWALNNIERQTNFGFLAVHRTSEVSKAIITNYYGSKPLYSYFAGCSRGGGQALIEAQRYPDDFDGIICGSPAIDWPGLGLEWIENYRAQYPSNDLSGNGIVTKANMKLLQNMVMDQFDNLDGIKDGIINNPGEHTLDFSSLPVCTDEVPADGCFTTRQIEVIKTIYEGISSQDLKIYPGLPLGTESGWNELYLASDTLAIQLGATTLSGAFGLEIFRYLVFNDPTWDYLTYNYSDYWKDIEFAASWLNATSTDYSKFKSNGGKMIIYHGWADQSISAYATIDLYDKIKNVDNEVEEFIRLFLLPGAFHCYGGVGPSQVDWLDYLQEWVENGNPPKRVTVSKWKNDTLIMTRPVFLYPRIAIYNGTGDPNEESSFIEKED